MAFQTKLKMSSSNPKVGHKVEALGKDCTGTIAYIGTTQFAGGKWIGGLRVGGGTQGTLVCSVEYFVEFPNIFRINPRRAKGEKQWDGGR